MIKMGGHDREMIVSSFFKTIFILYLAGFANSQTCTAQSGCSMLLDTGEKLDFCSTFSSGPRQWQSSTEIYTFDGNLGVDCDPNFPNQAICLGFPGSEIVIGIGVRTEVTCEVVSTGSSPEIFVWYSGGENEKRAKVQVIFDQAATTVDFALESIGDSAKVYRFVYRIPRSGENAPSSSNVEEYVDYAGIPGIILLIVLALAWVTYFVVGILVKKFHMGASGFELVPNLTFWKDLPFLLKDGAVFTFTAWPCCHNHMPLKGYNTL